MSKTYTPQVTEQDKASAKRGRELIEASGLPFGAPLTAIQVHAYREQVGRKEVPKMTGLSERQLRDYATGQVKAGELPKEAKKAIAEITQVVAALPEKVWARKTALALLVIHLERKSAKRRTRKAPAREEVAVA
jgi:hypothetical protein